MTALSLNQKLAAFRKRHDMSLRSMADLLRVSSTSTINDWENGANIPGPPSLLLEWLIDGKEPFNRDLLPQPLPPAVQDAIWNVSMNLEAWEKLDSMRVSGGFATVTDFIAALIQEELGQTEVDRSVRAPVDGMALVAETTPGGGVGVDAALAAGAEAYKAEHPLPAEEVPGTAGSGTGRKDVRYTRPPARTGISKGKR